MMKLWLVTALRIQTGLSPSALIQCAQCCEFKLCRSIALLAIDQQRHSMYCWCFPPLYKNPSAVMNLTIRSVRDSVEYTQHTSKSR